MEEASNHLHVLNRLSPLLTAFGCHENLSADLPGIQNGGNTELSTVETPRRNESRQA
jgi:hypothetical protein